MCVSSRLHATTLQISQGQWLIFDIIPQFQVHKTRLPVVSKFCKFIPRTKTMIHVCCQRTSQQEIESTIFSLRKQKYLKLVIKKGKMHQRVSCQVGDCKYSGFVRWKCCFLFRHQVLCSEKCFPTGSELCKGTPKSHCTIPLKKNSEKWRIKATPFCKFLGKEPLEIPWPHPTTCEPIRTLGRPEKFESILGKENQSELNT